MVSNADIDCKTPGGVLEFCRPRSNTLITNDDSAKGGVGGGPAFSESVDEEASTDIIVADGLGVVNRPAPVNCFMGPTRKHGHCVVS